MTNILKTYIHYSLVLIVIIGLFLSQGCASILNGRYQSVAIKTDSDSSTVYVDGVKVGTGKLVNAKLKRDLNAKSIMVERPGYKSEHYVMQQAVSSPLKVLSWIPFGVLFLIPPQMDKAPNSYDYKKELEVKNPRSIDSKKKGQKYLQLNDVKFDLKKEDILIKEITAKAYEYNVREASARRSIQFKDDVKVDNTIFADAVNDVLVKLGYIDTSNTLLTSNIGATYVNATVTKMSLTRIYNYKGQARSLTNAYKCELTINWEFLDKYKQVKLKSSNSVSSGVFVAGDYQKAGLQDAIMSSFYEVLKSSEAQGWLNSNTTLEDAVKIEMISLNRGNSVKDIKSALAATTVVKTDKGFGSGAVVSSDGYILTCYHVIAGQDSSVQVIFSDKDTLKAKVVRYSELADLAILKVNKECKNVFFMDAKAGSDAGEDVFAIGTPVSMEFGQTVSKGIISGLRKNEAGLKLIQTDVSVSPGNSGGPLVKKDGTFLGVVDFKVMKEGAEGLGFGTTVSTIMEQLRLQYK